MASAIATSKIATHSAAERVFSLPELLHEILLHLSHHCEEFDAFTIKAPTVRPTLHDLFLVPRVNRFWQYTIQHSTPLKKAMWLLPESNTGSRNLLNPSVCQAAFTVPGVDNTLPMYGILSARGRKWSDRSKISDFTLSFVAHPPVAHDSKKEQINLSFLARHSWRDMLAMRLGDVEDEFVRLRLYARKEQTGGKKALMLGTTTKPNGNRLTLGEVHDWIMSCHCRHYGISMDGLVFGDKRDSEKV